MKPNQVFLLLFVLLISCTTSFAQNAALARADKEYDLLRFKKAIFYYKRGIKEDSLNLKALEHLANSYRNINDYTNAGIWHAKYLNLNKTSRQTNTEKPFLDISKFYSDSARWKVKFTTLNTDFDEFGPVYFKGGLIITSNRYPGKINYVSGSEMKPFTDLYLVKDTSTIKQINFKGQNNIPQNMMAMVGGTGVGTNLDDNRNIGNFYVKSPGILLEYKEAGLAPATPIKGALKSKLNDGPLSFPADESWVMFTRNNIDGKLISPKDAKKLQLFSLRYINGKWANIESFQYNSGEYSTGHPSLSADGNTLYFVSDMPGGFGGTDLYYCVRMGYSWSKPVNLGNKVNTDGDEMFPFLDAKNNLYFSSTGLPGVGGLDIFYVQIKEHLPSGQPKNLGYPVNSNKDDFGIITTANGLAGYFSSDRRGNDDIYRFDRDLIVKDEENLAQSVKDMVESVPVKEVLQKNTPESSVTTVAQSTNLELKPLQEAVIPAKKPLTSSVKPTPSVPEPVDPVAQPIRSVTQPAAASMADPINGSRISVAENISAITTISASDADAGTKFSYSLNGGVDMAKFRINSTTGALTFISPPDFEKPSDVDGNSTYIAVLRASDGTNITDLPVIVTITDVNDNTPIIISNAALSVPENSESVTMIKARDTDAGTTLSYSLSGGADMGKFLINSSSGALTFISTPDFERPADSDNNNTYIVGVRASDGTHTADQIVVVTISDINDSPPVITSNATVSVPENTTAIQRITTSDADAGSSFQYSLSGGADVDKFSINSSNGALMFISAPDFEKPFDTDGNNNYIAVVRVSDGINTTDQTVVISINDTNDNAPLITSSATVSIPENATDVKIITAIDADAGSSFTYSLSGGADVIKFRINSSNGALTFISGPDFEKPADAGANNTYLVMVRASDGAKTSDQMLTVTVNDVNDNIPVITSKATISIQENNTAVITVKSTDADAGSSFSYSLSGGADAALFNINSSSGVLTFISPPDYEKPGDADSNNKYIVVIRASDGANNADQTIIVTVTDINDNAPVIKLN